MMAHLTSIISDELRTSKILTRVQLKELARQNGYEESSAERLLRQNNGTKLIPHVKLNRLKKPIKRNEHIMFYKYIGYTALNRPRKATKRV